MAWDRGIERVPLSQRTITEIERAHPGGLSSRQILDLLEANDAPMTEATLRKYVQLGLLPRSRRVGEKGKHRGSHGIYPVEVIRRIDEIRRAMTGGETLESLARATRSVRGKLGDARAELGALLEAAAEDLDHAGLERSERRARETELGALEKQGRAWLRAVEKWVAALEATPRKRTNGARGVDPRTIERTRQAVRRTARPARTRAGGV